MQPRSDLLRREIETLWVTDERGRLLRTRTRKLRPHPSLVVSADKDAIVWAYAASVPDRLAHEIDDHLRRTDPDDPKVGWVPACRDQLVELLATMGTIGEMWRGPLYVVEQAATIPSDVDWRAGGDDDRDSLVGLMPEDDRRTLDAPWVVAMADGQVAAVCETSRSAPTSVEAGVWTYDEYRRRGFGSAATAAWTTLVTDRTAFYSTNHDNLGSQGIARRLGLRPIGQMWHVSVEASRLASARCG